MKSGWKAVIALVVLTGALVVVLRVEQSEPPADAPPLRENRSGTVDRTNSSDHKTGAAPRGMTTGGPPERARPGSANAPSQPGEHPTGEHGPVHRRLPPAVAGNAAAAGQSARQIADSRSNADGVVADAPPGVGGKLAAPQAAAHARDLRLGGTDSLATGGAEEPPAADASDNAVPDGIPEVAYDGADRIFDTASRTEVTDAGEINGKAGTISFWFEPEWQHNNQDNAGFVQLGDTGLQVVKEGNYLRFQYTDGTGGGAVDISNWEAGGWRQVAATWDGATLSLYVDGQQVFLNHASSPPDFRGAEPKLYVGSGFPNAVALGQLSNLTVLNRGASSDEVKQMFESGPPGE